MILGILVFALGAGILATGYAQEMRGRNSCAPGTCRPHAVLPRPRASLIAEVARLLRAATIQPTP